jgi:hypothetical protein
MADESVCEKSKLIDPGFSRPKKTIDSKIKTLARTLSRPSTKNQI